MPIHLYGPADCDRSVYASGAEVYWNWTETCSRCGVERISTIISMNLVAEFAAATVLYYPPNWGDIPSGHGWDPWEHEPPCPPPSVLGNNRIDTATADEIRKLAASGAGIREISRVTGAHRSTVATYVGGGDRSSGLRRHHARRKAEGRPIFPPWHKMNRTPPTS